ncbi:RHS repeat domain-containing protein, partial [Planctopirus hydrillae]|uniref:RHS repeat domain-containing protein n=1 Tax=Planctopirus hydrillae TaxID=1841610 RepID=UPI0028F3FB81
SIQTFQEHGGTVNTGTTPSVQRGYANGSTNTVRPLSLTYPNGRELTYDYGTTNEINDALSRIGSIIDDDFSLTHLVDYEFLGLAGVIQQTSPQPNLRYTLAGVSNDPDTGDIYTGLDRFGRVKDSRWYNISTNNDLSRIQYGYDRASNRIWRKNPIATANGAEYDWLYTYDGLQRLKTAKRGTLNVTQTALTSTTFQQDWNLDPTGNWEGFKQSDNGSTWSMEQERTANPVNEITDITNTVGSPWADPAYNAVGNMTTIPKPKQMDETYTATYDAWNRLVKLEEEVSSTLETVGEYSYDARNFRIVVKNYDTGVLDETTHAYFTDGWQNIEERINSSSTPSQHHIWGLRYIDDCLLRDRTTDTTLDERLYALQDANWNVTAIIDNTGVVQERFEYDPYGTIRIFDPDFDDFDTSGFGYVITYCGYRWDDVTRMFVVRKRFLHTDTGMWVSRDPIDYISSFPSLFQYVRSQPTVVVDPTGLSDWTWPWDPNASWDPKNTVLLWGETIAAVPDVSGHANWILTGDRNASEEALNAASVGWIQGLGEIPGVEGASLGQWVYTGEWRSSEDSIKAAVENPEVREAVACVANCIADTNKQIAAAGVASTAGIIGGVRGAADVVPVPKFWVRWLYKIGRPMQDNSSIWTSFARAKSISPETFNVSPADRKYWHELAEQIKRGPKINSTSPLRTGKGTQINEIIKRGAPKALRCSVAAFAITETVIAAYCAHKCSK